MLFMSIKIKIYNNIYICKQDFIVICVYKNDTLNTNLYIQLVVYWELFSAQYICGI